MPPGHLLSGLECRPDASLVAPGKGTLLGPLDVHCTIVHALDGGGLLQSRRLLLLLCYCQREGRKGGRGSIGLHHKQYISSFLPSSAFSVHLKLERWEGGRP